MKSDVSIRVGDQWVDVPNQTFALAKDLSNLSDSMLTALDVPLNLPGCETYEQRAELARGINQFLDRDDVHE